MPTTGSPTITGDPIPPLRRNNYGVTIGGPIIKNKTFFFFDYDALAIFGAEHGHRGSSHRSDANRRLWRGMRRTGRIVRWHRPLHRGAPVRSGIHTPERIDANAAVALFATPSFRLTTSPPTSVRGAMPHSCLRDILVLLPVQPAPGVPGNLIDPVAQKMMSLFPEPNFQRTIFTRTGSARDPTTATTTSSISRSIIVSAQNNLLSGKFSYQYNHGTASIASRISPILARADPDGPMRTCLPSTTRTRFSPTLLLNVTLGFTRGVWHIDAYNPHGVDDPLGELWDFPRISRATDSRVCRRSLSISIQAPDTLTSAPILTATIGWGRTRDNCRPRSTRCTETHEIKFGFDGRIHQINYIQTNAPNGIFSFNRDGSYGLSGDRDTCGGDSMASFLMGQITQGGAGNGGGSYYEIQFRPATTNYQYGFFAQDNWKVNPKLTLNLGLRYDVTLPRTDRYNRQNWFDPNVASPLNGGSFTYNDPVSGQPVTVPLIRRRGFCHPQPTHELRDRLE